MPNFHLTKTRLSLSLIFFLSFFLLSQFIFTTLFLSQDSHLNTLEKQYLDVDRKGRFPPGLSNKEKEDFINDLKSDIKDRLEEIRKQRIIQLTLIEIIFSILGAIIAYILSGYALKPITEFYENQKKYIIHTSHELKTPITNILLTTEVEQENDTIKSINEDANRLYSEVESLLNILKLNNGLHKFQKENIELLSLFKDIEKIYISRLVNSDKKIIYDINNIVINTDKAIVKIILKNLIDNAIKYSPEYSNIYVNSVLSNNIIIINIENNILNNTKFETNLGIDIIKEYCKLLKISYISKILDSKYIATLQIPI